jgi:hypothetical protein
VRRAPAAPVARREERRPKKRRSPLRWIVAALILLLAGVAVALALTLPGGDRQHINNSDVPSQVQDLVKYVRDHTK